MGNVLDNSLYMNDQKKFQELFQAVIQFNSLYNGNNIIQDDIFSVLTNYARKKQEDLDLFGFLQKMMIFVHLHAYRKEECLLM